MVKLILIKNEIIATVKTRNREGLLSKLLTLMYVGKDAFDVRKRQGLMMTMIMNMW